MADHVAEYDATAPATAPVRHVTVCAVQMTCSPDSDANIRKAEVNVRTAAEKGAQVILLQELFATTYFPLEQSDSFRLAVLRDDERSYISKFRALAKELCVVLPISFYERANNAYFNTVVVIDADGSMLGSYRKSHIPDSPGYHEKWHFAPGDTGFRVFQTRYAAVGIGVCWDQWFPEAARCMALAGAELLLYPTAIGSEPQDPTLDSSGHWQRCMSGHAAANIVPLVASNRVGREASATSDTAINFYGSSFIADHTGLVVAEAPRDRESMITHTFNLDHIKSYRLSWGVYRDRRPDLYHSLITLSGTSPSPMAAAVAAAAAAAANLGMSSHDPLVGPGLVLKSRGATAAAAAAAAAAVAVSAGVGPNTTPVLNGTAVPLVHATDASLTGATMNGSVGRPGGLSVIAPQLAQGPHAVPHALHAAHVHAGHTTHAGHTLHAAHAHGALSAHAGPHLGGDAQHPTPMFHIGGSASGTAPVGAEDPTAKAPAVVVHDATFIGDVKTSCQRRPRARCWVCRSKTTYECKVCDPGPVPLCNRSSRECWWKYHYGEVTQFVVTNRGRKRHRHESEDDLEDDDDHDGGVGVPAKVEISGQPTVIDDLPVDVGVGVGVDVGVHVPVPGVDVHVSGNGDGVPNGTGPGAHLGGPGDTDVQGAGGHVPNPAQMTSHALGQAREDADVHAQAEAQARAHVQAHVNAHVHVDAVQAVAAAQAQAQAAQVHAHALAQVQAEALQVQQARVEAEAQAQAQAQVQAQAAAVHAEAQARVEAQARANEQVQVPVHNVVENRGVNGTANQLQAQGEDGISAVETAGDVVSGDSALQP